ncbi:MAG: hypothetical protein HUK08_09465 [Bacteroidaceae bacterium]|nr:hypothetical protein [Bacteroidaceae bacterium]
MWIHIILTVVFIGNIIIHAYEWYKFEKTKQSHSAEYISLYRKYKALVIVVYVTMTVFSTIFAIRD